MLFFCLLTARIEILLQINKILHFSPYHFNFVAETPKLNFKLAYWRGTFMQQLTYIHFHYIYLPYLNKQHLCYSLPRFCHDRVMPLTHIDSKNKNNIRHFKHKTPQLQLKTQIYRLNVMSYIMICCDFSSITVWG